MKKSMAEQTPTVGAPVPTKTEMSEKTFAPRPKLTGASASATSANAATSPTNDAVTASQELWERAKSTLRMRYEAEARVIQKKIGDLESIRGQLGLTQRKICQLLLVDPSAWTRWTKKGEAVPPHVYRALQWYLAVQEKYPALDTNFWLSTVAQVREPEENAARDERIQALGSDLSSVKDEIESLRAQAAKADRLERELKALAIRSRRQNIAIVIAAVAGSLIAGLIASRFM